MAVRIQFKNRSEVLKDILVNEQRLIEFGAEGVERVISLLYSKISDAASLTDHTLADLAAMGHPYSRRRPQMIHQPAWLVHAQGGTLLRSLGKTTSALGSMIKGSVYVDIGQAPHAVFVIYGTRKMVSRDFMGETARANIDVLLSEFISTLRQKMG